MAERVTEDERGARSGTSFHRFKRSQATENWGDFSLHVKLIWLVAIEGGEKVIDHFSGRPFP